MPKYDYKRQNTLPVMNNFYSDSVSDDDPDVTVDAKSEDWKPTPSVFKAFLVRDYQLATENITMLLKAREAPMSVRELKEQCLHSTDTIERVLTSKIASKSVKEHSGKYSLVNS
jgi:hypothetical protein